MSSNGRPNYDAGDLVVCVADPGPPDPPGAWEPVVGKTYTCCEVTQFFGDLWNCNIEEDPTRNSWDGWPAEWFRRIDPKPPEFWTGTVDADANEKVSA